LFGIIFQITDLILHNGFTPDQYFAYFTIQSSLINVVVLTVGGVLSLRHPRDTELYTRIRMSALCYAVMTAAVFNLLLRGHSANDGHYPGLDWPNEIMHVAIPIFLVIDWLFAPGGRRLRFTALWTVVSYPLAWVAFTLVRGAIIDWYPYPFLTPSVVGGYGGVSIYIVAIAGFILAIAVGAVAVGRVRSRASENDESVEREKAVVSAAG
jgi:uncharacterized membrane protein